MDLNYLPWQRELAQRWLGHPERFSHAWLIYGQEGIGKFQFAYASAASLLCEHPQNGLACGHCQACHWVSLQNHPDLRVVTPESYALELGLNMELDDSGKRNPSSQIKVEQIREIERQQFFTLSSHRGGNKVLVVYPAESLNTESANALLKILEEPVGQTQFLLVTHSLRKVLPTILSRCRRLLLPIPDHEQSVKWLATQGVENASVWLDQASQAPLKALALSQSDHEPVHYWLSGFVQSLAQKNLPDFKTLIPLLDALPAHEWVDSLQRLAFDLHLSYFHLPSHYYPSLQEQVATIAHRMKAEKIADLNQWLRAEQRVSTHAFNSKLYIQSTLQQFAWPCLKTASH